ncbi:RNA polymerase II subunit A C-terminal domain phosphatase [Lecanosticta acicola]|uniref:RNA polymerase II subunit A C-terminal domain phosphatase n=1 Tax=Lecanosticta acicola TaxID=111012 RepID=A0AAI8Z4B7_9PEZI|nr:RNA polymerase II subunit A C-terminal domain phosphatase [Lecanosticta acicola]
MRLYTPKNLLYPITVTKLLRQEGDDVPVNERLFSYSYQTKVTEFDKDKRLDVDVTKTLHSFFESELEGKLNSLNVKEGQVLTQRSVVADVEEPCKHEVQFGGLCANCGKDMEEVNSYNTSASNTERATINTVHGTTQLKISADEATRADEEAKRRLLDSRRLSLVVDLDQTVIHASVEPTIGEWQSDPSNPNHEALKDVCKFQLLDDIPSRSGTWYYIKLRPGLKEFLNTMSEYYEMHIYTMGTRAYAENIARIIDPERKVFGDRILSRDESGSMTAKNLRRLFPVDTKMVIIIDDRADVWHWIPNLVKVNVYEFFVGIGDINSSFLPKRPEVQAKNKGGAKMERLPSNKRGSDSSSSSDSKSSESDNFAPSTAPTTPPSTNGETTAVEQMLTMAGNKDGESLKSKEEAQEQTITAQLKDRPLLQKQKILDAIEEEEAKASPAVEAATELLSESGEAKEEMPADNQPKNKYRHNLLQDDDTELQYLGQSLRSIHDAYYDEYDKAAMGSKGSRVAELRPGHTKKRSMDDREYIPDAAAIMDGMKKKVLAGIHIVFSGVVPLGVDIQNHDTAIWAKSFGANVSDNINKKTTHVIASPERRTAKVRQAAAKGGRIAIVSQSWLHACFSQWAKVDENPYRIHSDNSSNGTNGLPDSFESKDYMLSSSDEEAAQTEDEIDGRRNPNGTRNGLTLETGLHTDNEDWEQYKPTTPPDEASPAETEQDWKDVDAELAEFLGSDLDDDSDTESIRSERTEKGDELKTPPSQRKRKSDDRDGEDDVEESRLQKRKREALDRTSSLTNLAATGDSSPATDLDDNDHDDDAGGRTEDDDDLEAALAAEMERQSSEEDEEAAEFNGGGTNALNS